jgi:hypothetical protein
VLFARCDAAYGAGVAKAAKLEPPGDDRLKGTRATDELEEASTASGVWSRGLAIVMMRHQGGRRTEVMQAVLLKPKSCRNLGTVNQGGRLREVVAGR